MIFRKRALGPMGFKEQVGGRIQGQHADRVCRRDLDRPGWWDIPTGNMLYRLWLELPDDLATTVQSSNVELYVKLMWDGEEVPVLVHSEDFAVVVSG